MREYIRPPLPATVYTDDDGAVIDFGNRWGMGSPPEDSYSRETHLDRFDGLHLIADALVAWITESFDVEVDDGPHVIDDFLHRPTGVVRATRITPRSSSSAPLTIALTTYPGVLVHAGALSEFLFPVCGCDACDESTDGLAEQLEWTVRRIVLGHFSETIARGVGVGVGNRLEDAAGNMRSTSGPATGIATARVRAARDVLPVGGTWLPYTPR